MRPAEWVLGLVTTPERAASIAGDLWESAGPGGAVRFWWDVVRIASSLVWRDVAGAPWLILKLALRAWARQFFWGALFGSLAGLAAGAIFDRYILVHASRLWSASLVGELVADSVIQFTIGRWIARNAVGHEVAVWLTMVTVPFALSIVVIVGYVLLWHGHLPGALHPAYWLLEAISLATAISLRRNRGARCEIRK